MANSRPKSNAQPEKVFARKINDILRRVRALELRPDPSTGGGGGGGTGIPEPHAFSFTVAKGLDGSSSAGSTAVDNYVDNGFKWASVDLLEHSADYDASNGLFLPLDADGNVESCWMFMSCTIPGNNQATGDVGFGLARVDPDTGETSFIEYSGLAVTAFKDITLSFTALVRFDPDDPDDPTLAWPVRPAVWVVEGGFGGLSIGGPHGINGSTMCGWQVA